MGACMERVVAAFAVADRWREIWAEADPIDGPRDRACPGNGAQDSMSCNPRRDSDGTCRGFPVLRSVHTAGQGACARDRGIHPRDLSLSHFSPFSLMHSLKSYYCCIELFLSSKGQRQTYACMLLLGLCKIGLEFWIDDLVASFFLKKKEVPPSGCKLKTNEYDDWIKYDKPFLPFMILLFFLNPSSSTIPKHFKKKKQYNTGLTEVIIS